MSANVTDKKREYRSFDHPAGTTLAVKKPRDASFVSSSKKTKWGEVGSPISPSDKKIVNAEEAFESILSYPAQKESIYIGFSFPMDLNVLAQRSVERAYLSSDNPRVLKLYQWIQSAIVKTPSRHDFLSALENELASKEEFYLEVGCSVREFLDEISSPKSSWLYNDARYGKVRELYQKGEVIHIGLTLKERDTVLEIANTANDSHQVFDVINLHGAGELAPMDLAELAPLYSSDTILVSPSVLRYGTGLKVTQPKAPVTETRSELFHALNRRSFRYDPSFFHGHPFLLTTETGHPGIFQAIDKVAEDEESHYLGFAFEFNYNLLARRKFKKAYICDIAPCMAHLYGWVQDAVMRTDSRKEFMAQFQEELFVHHDRYFPELDMVSDKMLIAYLQDVFTHYATYDYSWLRDDASYSRVRALYQNGQIVHFKLNLAQDTGTITALAQEASRLGRVFGVLYITNIAEWVRFKDNDNYDTMIQSLELLLSKQTLLVDSKRAKPFKGLAASRLSVGEIPDFTFDRRDEIPLLEKYRRSQARRQGRNLGGVRPLRLDL